MIFEDLSHCLCRDWTRNDGIDVVGSLDSIGSSACSDLSNDSMLRGG